MRISLLICLGVAILLSGCATLEETPSHSEVYRLKDRISILEEELDRKRKENLELKEAVAELERLVEERTILKVPTGSEIQSALKRAGFYQGEIDGQIGPNTKQAIRKFQQANDLNPDGVVGSRTWELLRQYLGSESEDK